MKNIRGLIALFLVLLVFAQTGLLGVSAATSNTNSQPTTYSKESNSGTRDVIANTLSGTSAGTYYTGNYAYNELLKKSGTELYNSLHSLMTNTHTNRSSYDDCHYEADRTDCENNNGKVSLIYTGYSATMSQWNGWNREHVWPKSLGGDSTTGGGADLHHIRPSDQDVNSTRGNKKYGYATNGKNVYGSNPATDYLGGKSGTYFEPLDNVKGDVARICLYVYVRWGSDWGATSITKVFESEDVLLEWCALDPVDTWELGRNEVIQDIQGNRNVFIDYPELAWKLFNKEVPANMTSPSNGNPDGVTSPTTSTEKPSDTPSETPSDKPSNEPTGTPIEDAPEEGIGYIVSASNSKGVLYFNGTVSSGTFKCTYNASEAALVYVEAVNGGYLMYIMEGTTKNYINIADKADGGSLTTNASSATVYEWNADKNTMAVADDANNRGFGVGATTTNEFFKSYDLSGNYNWGQFTAVIPEDPGTDNPGTDNPGADNPGTDNPGTDNPGTDNPGTDNPSTGDTKKEPTGFIAWLVGIINAILAIFGLKMVV